MSSRHDAIAGPGLDAKCACVKHGYHHPVIILVYTMYGPFLAMIQLAQNAPSFYQGNPFAKGAKVTGLQPEFRPVSSLVALATGLVSSGAEDLSLSR